MKIAIVCYPTFGGSGVVATELGIELTKRNHEVHFITYSQPVRLALLNKNIHYHEVVVPEYPLFHYQPYELALSSKIVDTVKEYGIDLLHVHYAIPHAFAGYMAKQMLADQGISLPMVTTLHGTDITLVGNHPFYKTAVSFSINQSDYVTSVSADLKKSTYELFDTTKDIHVIPNFIEDKNVAHVQCKRNLFAEDSERIVTHVSNFRKVKRILDVVKVFDGIQKEMPAKLMMVGDGPERLGAEELVKELGIENKVIFFGNSSEIDSILKYSDLFLLPSETESFGLAALEAMANKVPVISSNAGGLPEVNVQGVSGYMDNIGDTDGMVQHAIEILKDDLTLQQFKEQAYAHSKNFNVDKIVPLYEAIYNKALKNTLV
ncbi:N-acetyl-alpha-D-glucosaminyl L-malate synthase BshA [Paenimyroides viscosum]|uniref:N-acetyl-alpha-D-glucosaminyl L-malate synthase BshA n=1 Tax=Paenimyroides viscosum TaxID=2488729 RepID=A0A3P1B0K8_9FLAO|nr:N-acetyl-alpha-D-glucosaminyl L-malate synthase BshA [Paenimyroides viscosum]RRA93763.1 N-acetyl-alpha-D-glucosaminyl L-malate synthase BshA [Paenimyroides viscosum]